MPGSSTTPGRPGTRVAVPVRIAFRLRNGVDAQGMNLYEAQWLAYALPYRRFAAVLTDCDARLGADRIGRVGPRRGPGFEGCRRLLYPPYHSVRRVFPGTAGRLAFQTGPSQYIGQLKPAPGMRWSVSGLRPSLVRLVTSAMAPL